MDSFELNKIMGGVLGALLFAMGLNVVGDMVFAPHRPAVPGYDLPAPEEAAPGAAGGAAETPAEPLPVLLAKADAAAGEKAVAKCKACHVFEKGGSSKVGPDLWAVVGRPIAQHAGFDFSPALKGKGGSWEFDSLNQFIQNPKGFAPGTKMSFAGVPRAEERANILAYLNTLSESPKPLPKPEQAAQQQPAAQPGQGGQQPGQPAPKQEQPGHSLQPKQPDPAPASDGQPKPPAQLQTPAQPATPQPATPQPATPQPAPAQQ